MLFIPTETTIIHFVFRVSRVFTTDRTKIMVNFHDSMFTQVPHRGKVDTALQRKTILSNNTIHNMTEYANTEKPG